MAVVPKNVLEELLSFRLNELIGTTDSCDCEQCRADILAMALNKLPSRYVVSATGDIFSRFQALSPQMQANITTTLLNAIDVVKKAPRHKKAD